MERQNDNKTDPTTWVDRYGDFLFGYALARLRDRQVAEDVVQETFLAALKSRRTFAGDSSERTWLTGILKHKIADSLRRTFREHAADPDEPLPSEKEQVFRASGKWTGHWFPDKSPWDWGTNPDSFLESREFWRILDACLKELPARLASVFLLYEMEEQSAEEICKGLEITSTNLWVMLHRSRRQLRRCLEIHWIGPDPKKKR
ncbi:MAG TPA: sigma-70 family RNA polymerase sigma factor [Candidatus Deferrimicrobium sp.]|nr:sigma-70 family RNA polymerase sigma factor [Candidatus Deferrimicrobium sp.]